MKMVDTSSAASVKRNTGNSSASTDATSNRTGAIRTAPNMRNNEQTVRMFPKRVDGGASNLRPEWLTRTSAADMLLFGSC